MVCIEELVWDDGNLDHIEDDNGIPFENVEVSIFERRSHAYSKGNRLIVIGQSGGGEYLTTVLEPTGGGLWRPVTARFSDKKEVQLAKKHFLVPGGRRR